MPPCMRLGPFQKSLPLRDLRLTPASYIRSPLTSTPTLRPASQWGPIGRRQPPRYNRFNSPGFRYGVGAVGVGGGVFYYINLERVPVSGRLRFNCISEATEESAAEQQFQMVMQEFRGRVLPPNHPSSRLVNRVLERLKPVSGLAGQKWEVRVIDDPEQKNAFVMPG